MRGRFVNPWRTATLLLFAVITLTSPTPASAQSEVACGQCPNLPSCNILRSVGVGQVDGIQTSGYEKDHCFAKSDLGSGFASIIVRTFSDSNSADDEGIKTFVGMSGWQESSGYGERTIACTTDDCLWPGQTGGLIFHRGCYTVQGAWDSASEQQVRAKLSQLDAMLRSAPCPGSAPPSTLPPAGSLGVSLNCEHEFEDPGLVKCTAQPINPSPGATISYGWTVDGGAQGALGTDLELNGVKPGPHTVTVVAHDTNNNLTSEQETVSFTKGQPGETGGGSNLGGGAPKLGSWGSSTVPGGGANVSSSGPIVPSGGSNFNPAAILAGLLGIAVLGAAVVVVRRRHNAPPPPPTDPSAWATRPPLGPETLNRTRRKPPTDSPEALRPPSAPARQPAHRKPPTSGPEVLATSPSTQNQPDQLWLVADPTTVTIHGNAKETTPVRIRAFKSVNGVPLDASNEVRITVQPPADDKHVMITPIDNLNFTVKGVHIGTQPHDCQITVSGVSLSTGKSAAPVQILVRIIPVKVEVRIGVIKKGFLYQELVATIPDICRTVTGRVVEIDPASDLNLDELSDNVGADLRSSILTDQPQTPTDGNQPVAYARCWASSRADGANWSSPRQLTTDDRGQFRFGILRRFAEYLDAENVDYELPTPVELSVNNEVSQSYKTYCLELETFKRHTSDRVEGAFPGDSPLADARSSCADYPHRFFLQLCANKEDDYNLLLGSINLLRGSIIFSYKYRDGFKDERSIVNQCAKDVFGGIIDVILALPISTSLVKWVSGERLAFTIRGRTFQFPSLKDFFLEIARVVAKIPGGKLLLKALVLGLKAGRYVLLGLMKTLRAFLQAAIQLAEKVRLTPRFLQFLMDCVQGAPAEGEAIVSTLRKNVPDDFGSAIAEVYFEAARGFLLLGALAREFFYSLPHICIMLAALAIRVFAATISAIMKNLGYEGAIEFWGEVLDNQIGSWLGEMYDSAGKWLEAKRAEPDKTPSKSLCDTIMDKVWSLEDMDRTIADCLNQAYESSVGLEVPNGWLDHITNVSRIEDALMTQWNKDYTTDDKDSWGWIQIGEEISRWVKLAAKIFQMIMLAEAVLIEGLIKLAAKIGFQLFDGPSTETPVGLTSTADLVVDSSDLFFRAAIFGAETMKLYTLIHALPERIRVLYTLTETLVDPRVLENQ